jgi:hypothetical protein
MWKEKLCSLRWTEGHIWVLDKPIITANPFFKYKYKLVDKNSKLETWEHGVDRIADLRILAEEDSTT